MGHTIAAASSLETAVKDRQNADNNISVARFIGKLLADRVLKKGITHVVFDRNGFLYHGRVKAVSEGAREAGLKF
jgi:large subunit ribosomal protein L18